MSWEVLRALIAQGFGQGHGDHYRAWLQVSRSRSSPCSNLGRKFLPGSRRVLHTLSANEWCVALLANFLGACDVREQFPLWPMPHAHPLHGHPDFENGRFAPSSGTLQLAEMAEIQHGNFVGSVVPNVLTIDLLVTVRSPSGLGLGMISCKPRAQIERARPSNRMRARLMLEKIYAKEISAHYAIADQKIMNTAFRANLERFAPTRATLREFSEEEQLLCRIERSVNGEAANLSKRELVRRVARDLSLDQTRAHRAFCLLVWQRRVDFDFSVALTESLPLPLGGHRLNQELRRQLFGED